MLEVETPERCQWLRVMAAELGALGDHLTRCGAPAWSSRAMTPFLYGIEARELTWDLQEMLCGARVTSNYVRIGGVKHEMPEGFPATSRRDSIVQDPRAAAKDFDAVITGNRIFVDRCKAPASSPRRTWCIEYAVTGPDAARRRALPLDLRKAEPYLVYDEIDFDVPIGEVGDNYDRYLVCVEEMQQSLRIIEQCLARLEKLGPGARQRAGRPASSRWPGQGRVFNRMEELIQQFKGVTEGPQVPAGEAYTRTSSRPTASSASTWCPTAPPSP